MQLVVGHHDAQTVHAHRFHMRGPLVDKTHIASGTGEIGADAAAYRACAITATFFFTIVVLESNCNRAWMMRRRCTVTVPAQIC